jgi:Domain of unknown function (DUF4335)
MSVLSPTISKLYTPPTCTLEVTAKASPLSRWTRTPTIKSLQFLLSFDSLAQRARESVEIYGDETQLSALTETVTQYIQTVLASRPTELPLSPPEQTDSPVSVTENPSAVALRPRSLLTHELLLGNLATAQSGPSLVLKVSQLYDLATALEDCTADLQQLPTFIAAERPVIMPFLRSAALVLLTVGLGTATWRLFQTGPIAVNTSSPSSTTAMAPSATPTPSALAPVPSAPPRALNLPSIQLPTRSSNPSAADSLAQKDKILAEEDAAKGASSGASRSTKNTQPSQTVASAPDVRGETQDANEPQIVASAPSANSMERSRSLSQSAKAAPISPNVANKPSTLFDTIPQVAEVRDYVASRWQPSSPPPKTLEYRVTVNGDGSLGAVEPLGVSAQQYLGQVPLPQGSGAFVSPPAAGSRPSIRMLLHQDGTVQTFLDNTGQ